jgi:hypothetical protein
MIHGIMGRIRAADSTRFLAASRHPRAATSKRRLHALARSRDAFCLLLNDR